MGSPELDAAYWSSRYQQQDTGWDAGSITTPLKAYVDQLENKDLKILIPGAGNAHEAEYLFNAGFKQVFICDLTQEPFDHLLKRCPGFDPGHLLLQDFFDLQGGFDLIIEQTFFCALEPSLRPAYFKKMAELLNPGGRLVGLLFNDVLNTDKPPFGGNKDEYLGYIPSSLTIKTFEAAYNSIKPRQDRELFINLVRQKPGEL
jgi:SAM-dependent methyltransferase